MKISIVIASAMQAMVLTDEKSLECSRAMASLTDETMWLAGLVIGQLAKVIICTIVQCVLYRSAKNVELNENSFSQPSFKEDEEVLPTENSYIDFENDCNEYDSED